MPAIPEEVLDTVVYLYPDVQSAHAGERAGGSGCLVAAGLPLRLLQRRRLMQPASRFSTRDRRPHRSHFYKERKGGPSPRRRGRVYN